eukprot:TRINITY_DN2449_c0_g1_i10.p1 TRINITY_DN2449_c0_g1~~TRINITY_DN2449_c0_g1_i10.p1  ORF type:complete len:283 (-),score=94.94 TRINITY_DN2449_c0_g1_i10:153-1001(-)
MSVSDEVNGSGAHIVGFLMFSKVNTEVYNFADDNCLNLSFGLLPDDRPSGFMFSDLDLLQHFADMFSIPLANCEIEKKQVLEELQQKVLCESASIALGGDTIIIVLRKIFNCIARAIPHEGWMAFVVTADHTELLLLQSSDPKLARGSIRMPLGYGVEGNCALNAEVINIQNIYDDENDYGIVFSKIETKSSSMMCVPVVGPSGTTMVLTLLGKIDIIGDDPYFNEREEELMIDFAECLSLSVSHAKRVFEIRERTATRSKNTNISGSNSIDHELRFTEMLL